MAVTVYTNPRTGQTVALDETRPELVAAGWTLVTDQATPAAVAAIAELDARRDYDAHVAELIAQAEANRAAGTSGSVDPHQITDALNALSGQPSGLAALDAGGDVPADELGNVALTAADISGLGNAATRNVGTGAGTVAAGNDSRFAKTDGTATGYLAHVEGEGTSAAGEASHAEGHNSYAGGDYSHAEGSTTSATGINSHAQGNFTVASGSDSHAEGIQAVASRRGQHSHGAGQFTNGAPAQAVRMVFATTTTDATPTTLTSSLGNTPTFSGASTNVLTVGANRGYRFRVEAVARRSDVAGDFAAWTITGTVVRDSGDVRFISAPTVAADADAAAAAWTLAVTADTTTQALLLTATGEAGKTIRWSAALYATEVS